MIRRYWLLSLGFVVALGLFIGLFVGADGVLAHSLTSDQVNMTFNAPLASTGTQSESGTFTATYAPDGRINASAAYVAVIPESSSCPNTVTSAYDQLPNVANTEASGEIISFNPGRICLLIAYINNADLHGPFVLVYSVTPSNSSSDDYIAGRARCFTGSIALNGGPWVASQASSWRNQARCGFEGGTWRLRPSNLADDTGDDDGSYVCSDDAFLNENRCVWEGGTWSALVLDQASCESTSSWWNLVGQAADGARCLIVLVGDIFRQLKAAATFDLTCDNVNILNALIKLPACLLIPDANQVFSDLQDLGTEIGNQLGPFGEPIHYFTAIATFPADIENCGSEAFIKSTDDRILWISGKLTLTSRSDGFCELKYSKPGDTNKTADDIPLHTVVNAVNSGTILVYDFGKVTGWFKDMVGPDVFLNIQRVLAVSLGLIIVFRVIGEYF